MRVAAYPESVAFETDSLGQPIVYVPFSIGHEVMEADSSGSIPTLRLTAQNLTREMMALMESYNGLVGQKVRIVLVRRATSAAIRDDIFNVLRSSAREDAVQLTLGQSSLQTKRFPDRLITRTHCAHDYGGVGCGYDTKRGGALQTCDKTYDGVNGCKAHGANELAGGVTVRHPQRILLFLGVARRGGIGVS